MDHQSGHTGCIRQWRTPTRFAVPGITSAVGLRASLVLSISLLISCAEPTSSTFAEKQQANSESGLSRQNYTPEQDAQRSKPSAPGIPDQVTPTQPSNTVEATPPPEKAGSIDNRIAQPNAQEPTAVTSQPGIDTTNSQVELVYLNTGRDTEEIQSDLDIKYPPNQNEFTAVKVSSDMDIEIDLELFGQLIPPGTYRQIDWTASQSYEGSNVTTPILVMNGNKSGQTLCLTAAVHGDELNGIEIIRRVFSKLKVRKLSGTVIGVPIVNLQAFRETSRYLPDRRDLNRFFPGNPKGSSASRIASSLFNGIIQQCDALVDLHTGSFRRTNMPQLRADLNNPRVVELTRGFGATVILHSDGGLGTLRRAATDAGIPAVTLEAGESMRLQEDAVAHGVKGIQSLLYTMGMYPKRSLLGPPKPTFYNAKWIRADQSGILFSQIKLGKKVKIGDILGTVTDPINNQRSEIRSPYDGLVLGMALNQLVMPGYATYRIGIQAKNADTLDTNSGPDEFEDSE